MELPQTWNKYVYVRNNPLQFIDPSGEQADIAIDKKNKVITVTTTIAIYNDGKGKKALSSDELKNIKDKMKAGIESAWNGKHTKNGVTYTVKVNVDVKDFGSKKEAEKSGLQNVIGMKKGYVEESLGGITNPSSSKGRPDTGSWGVFDSDNENANLWGHEFGHLLGVGDHDKSGCGCSNDLVGANDDVLMRSSESNGQLEAFRQSLINKTSTPLIVATQRDYKWTFSGAIDASAKSTNKIYNAVFRAGSVKAGR